MTLFPEYMAENHHYELPKPPPPLCAFKYHVKKMDDLKNSIDSYPEAVEHFGAFLFDEFPLPRKIAGSIDEFKRKVRLIIYIRHRSHVYNRVHGLFVHKIISIDNKVPKPTIEIFVVVMKRINEEIFLGFAGINPYFATEEEDEVKKVIAYYFSDLRTGTTTEDYYYDMVEDDIEEEHYYESNIYY